MPRAALLVFDSLGLGGAPDAEAFGDAGADTLGHVAEACALGRGDRAGLRAGPLRIPHLTALGLTLASEASTGRLAPGLIRPNDPRGLWGCAQEVLRGKDTPSGHWEMAGAPLQGDWGYFAHRIPFLLPDIRGALIERGRLPGLLGEKHASGIEIIEEFGAEHVATAKPIVYTSVDSVLQIAAHEEIFGLERLYDLCRLARELCNPLNIGRIIARPFVGDAKTGFARTPRRKDFSIPPPMGNLLDRAAQAGRAVVSIGKIGDIFGHRSTGREIKRTDDMSHFDALIEVVRDLPDGGLVLANFVDLDTEHGHRRDPAGYAAALEKLDARLPELDAALKPGDLCALSADHGNDPTWRGTDHTREDAPVLLWGPGISGRGVGRRATFADIGASLAAHLRLPAPVSGLSML